MCYNLSEKCYLCHIILLPTRFAISTMPIKYSWLWTTVPLPALIYLFMQKSQIPTGQAPLPLALQLKYISATSSLFWSVEQCKLGRWWLQVTPSVFHEHRAYLLFIHTTRLHFDLGWSYLYKLEVVEAICHRSMKATWHTFCHTFELCTSFRQIPYTLLLGPSIYVVLSHIFRLYGVNMIQFPITSLWKLRLWTWQTQGPKDRQTYKQGTQPILSCE